MSQALQDLAKEGVAVWLDDLSRPRLQSGALARMVAQGEVVGITTNPTIFAKAIGAGSDYEEQLRELALRGTAIGETLRLLTAWDVRAACDVLRPVYGRTGGRDGRVSIEVDPRISGDAERTAAEARGLWWLVDRHNLFIKIPATLAGLPAITATLADGISVNVTLIFSVERYEAVLDAYLTGLERRMAAGGDLLGIESVASFFVSRVDTEVDRRLADLAARGDGQDTAADAARLHGQAAIANAGWPTKSMRTRLPLNAGRHWRPRAPECSGCSGPPRASRTRRSRIPATSPPWWRATRSTPCRKPRCKPWPTTARCRATPSAAATTLPAPYSATWPGSA